MQDINIEYCDTPVDKIDYDTTTTKVGVMTWDGMDSCYEIKTDPGYALSSFVMEDGKILWAFAEKVAA